MTKQAVLRREDTEIDINAYLDKQEKKELLRFITCGNVDDGKSTLIGRLLHDTKMIYEDQLSAVKNESTRYGTTDGDIDLALVVDGLQAEREQGITIDVAYRYFSTDARKFIIADTPGHEQFTRNMATGASTADLAIILIDARTGVQVQTRRHSFIANLLGIRHVIVAINKMDLVNYEQTKYDEICADYQNFSNELNIDKISFVPISALCGDNVVNASVEMSWYSGPSLMRLLEDSVIDDTTSESFLRFPVQYVNRPNLNFRGYCGTVASGVVREGDEVVVLPSNVKSSIKSIVTYDGTQKEASKGQSVTLTLNDQLDVSRGDMIVPVNAQPAMSDQLLINLIWLSEHELAIGSRFLIKQGTRTLDGTVSAIEHKVNVNTLEKEETTTLELNEIGVCQLLLEETIAYDPYEQNHTTGSLILIDKLTNATVGAGLIVGNAETQATGEIGPDLQAAFEAELKVLVAKYFGKLK